MSLANLPDWRGSRHTLIVFHFLLVEMGLCPDFCRDSLTELLELPDAKLAAAVRDVALEIRTTYAALASSNLHEEHYALHLFEHLRLRRPDLLQRMRSLPW